MPHLPRKADINVFDTLDEQCAERHFLGKTREEIYEQLQEKYVSLHEDLVFMGPVGFAYYAPAWEQLFGAFSDMEETDDVAEWTLSIISIRCVSLEGETPGSIAALHRLLDCCESHYNSPARRQYCTEQARLYGYAESLIDTPPGLEKHLKKCARLRSVLNARG